MMRHPIIGTLVLVLVAGSILVAGRNNFLRSPNAPGPAAIGTSNDGDRDEAARPVLPKRRALDPPPFSPPSVPAEADAISPLTLDVMVLQQTPSGQVHTLRQTITRTSTRMHVAPSQGREWLYERNPIDARRLSAFLIDHTSKTIVSHSDSDLRNVLAISGWAQALTLGFDAALLANATPSRDIRVIDGITFARFRVPSGGKSLDVWWSPEQLLTAEFTRTDDKGLTRFSIQGIRRAVDQNVLRPPESRFPDYRSVDLADWLEHR